MPLFPAADACLLAANLLGARHGDPAGREVVCLDWTLLPSAMLLAGYGAHVYLPPDTEHENEVKSLSKLLAEAIHGSIWSVTEAATTHFPQNSLVYCEEGSFRIRRQAHWIPPAFQVGSSVGVFQQCRH